jgi:siderophore synthetase component
LEHCAVVRQLLKTRQVKLLRGAIPATPLVSIRTLRVNGNNLEVKLSLSATITSEKRVIYQTRAQNAPIVSDILEKISSDLCGTCFQKDIASVRFKDFIKGPCLTCIYREGIARAAKPAVYLFDPLATSGSVPLQQEIDKFVKNGHRPIDFFKAYVRVLISGPLKLMIKYGIGVEPHLQNCLVRFKHGVPRTLILRDLDGANVNKKVLSQYVDIGNYPWHPYTWRTMRADAFSMDRLFHSMIYSHVGSLVEYYVRAYNMDEGKLWELVRDIVGKAVNSAAKGLPARSKGRAAAVTKYLNGQTFNLKCLLRMKLSGTEVFVTRKYKTLWA